MPSSSPLCSSQPGEIAALEREAERRERDELRMQVGDLKKVNKIWKKECESLKDKVNDKKREATLAKNEAFELTKRLSSVANHLGFDATPSFLDFLRTSPQPPPLKETSSQIATLQAQLADSTSSRADLQTKLEAAQEEARITKDALLSSRESQKVVVDGLQKTVEREKNHADGLAVLLKEANDWRGRETQMEEETALLREELTTAKADAAGLKRELEIRAVGSSAKPLGDNTTLNSPSQPTSRSPSPSPALIKDGLSKLAVVARLESLLKSSRAEYNLLYTKNKKQKAAWKDYAECYPVAFDKVRAKEQKREKRRESRGGSPARGSSEVPERPLKRAKIDPPIKEVAPPSSREVSVVPVEQTRKESSPSLGRAELSPSATTGNDPSPALSPAPRRNPTSYRSPSVAHQSRSSSLVPTVIESSPPRNSARPSSSPPVAAAPPALTFHTTSSALHTPIQPSNASKPLRDPSARKTERRPHPLGQHAFGPSDIDEQSSSPASTTAQPTPNPSASASAARPPPHQPTAVPSRAQAADSPPSYRPPPGPSVAPNETTTPARLLLRDQGITRASHVTPQKPNDLTVAERDRLTASRPWLGKKNIVSGQPKNIDPLDLEVPEGAPFEIHRHTSKSVRSEPANAGSSSRMSSSITLRVRSHGDAPLQQHPDVKIEPEDVDLFDIHIPNPKVVRVLRDSDDEPERDPFYRSPESQERDEERRRALKDPTAGMTPDEKSIFLKKQRNVPTSETRKLYAPFKGRGRYDPNIDVGAPGSSKKIPTINDEFMIDKSKNDGRDYAFNSVVRGKEQRKQLHARDCACCRGYYEAVGPLPPGPQGPRWKDAAPESDEDDDEVVDENGAGPSRPRRRKETKEERGKRKRNEEIQKHRQEVSRHRDEWAGPPTPPFYWDIGFPDSQKVNLINEAAEQIEKDKRARVEEEARMADGRYQRRY